MRRCRDRGYRHLPVAAQGDPSVAEDFLPISHLIFSNLKSWLRGCYHGVSPQHLQAYLNEFKFRFNRRFYPFNAFRSLLGISGQAVAPTYDGLYTGSWQRPKCNIKSVGGLMAAPAPQAAQPAKELILMIRRIEA
jgi:hypothetical protein